MDRFTYQKLREERPDLDLPMWHRLRRTDRHRAKRMNREQLIAGRVRMALITAGTGNPDAVQTIQIKNVLKASKFCPDLKLKGIGVTTSL